MSKYCIGIDLGGTFVKFGILDDQNRPGQTFQLRTPDDPEAVIQQMIHGAKRLIDQQDVCDKDILGVGIGSPGPLGKPTPSFSVEDKALDRMVEVVQLADHRFSPCMDRAGEKRLLPPPPIPALCRCALPVGMSAASLAQLDQQPGADGVEIAYPIVEQITRDRDDLIGFDDGVVGVEVGAFQRRERIREGDGLCHRATFLSDLQDKVEGESMVISLSSLPVSPVSLGQQQQLCPTLRCTCPEPLVLRHRTGPYGTVPKDVGRPSPWSFGPGTKGTGLVTLTLFCCLTAASGGPPGSGLSAIVKRPEARRTRSLPRPSLMIPTCQA